MSFLSKRNAVHFEDKPDEMLFPLPIQRDAALTPECISGLLSHEIAFVTDQSEIGEAGIEARQLRDIPGSQVLRRRDALASRAPADEAKMSVSEGSSRRKADPALVGSHDFDVLLRVGRFFLGPLDITIKVPSARHEHGVGHDIVHVHVPELDFAQPDLFRQPGPRVVNASDREEKRDQEDLTEGEPAPSATAFSKFQV